MAVQTAIARPVSLHVGILGMVLIAAAAFGTGIGLGASNLLAPASRTEVLTQPGPAFNAPGFRLDEKLSLAQPAPGFNAPGFRLDEKLPLAQPAPGFVAPGLQLQEKGY